MKNRYRTPPTQEKREQIENSNRDYIFLRENGLNAKTVLKMLGIAYKKTEVKKQNGTLFI